MLRRLYPNGTDRDKLFGVVSESTAQCDKHCELQSR